MASFQSTVVKFLIRRMIDWNKPLPELRKDLERLNAKVKIAKDVMISPVTAGGVNAELLRPMGLTPAGAAHDKIVVYLHGGGYCMGIVNTNRNFVARFAKESGYKTLLVDYRLAPENPYPAALEDAIAVYRWLLKEGYLPRNIIMAGDSSGCGLCLATLLSLKTNREPMPAALVLMSPVVDLKGTGESLQTRAKADPFQLIDPLAIARQYLGGNDPESPLISPLFADLKDLPPLLIQGGNDDVFLSDASRLAEKANKAGVDVTLRIWDKMWHIFQMNADLLPEARMALREASAYINGKFV